MSSLNRHRKPADKKLHCPDCTKSFPSASGLAEHAQWHAGVRAHVCRGHGPDGKPCTRAFVTESLRNQHERGVHDKVPRRKRKIASSSEGSEDGAQDVVEEPPLPPAPPPPCVAKDATLSPPPPITPLPPPPPQHEPPLSLRATAKPPAPPCSPDAAAPYDALLRAEYLPCGANDASAVSMDSVVTRCVNRAREYHWQSPLNRDQIKSRVHAVFSLADQLAYSVKLPLRRDWLSVAEQPPPPPPPRPTQLPMSSFGAVKRPAPPCEPAAAAPYDALLLSRYALCSPDDPGSFRMDTVLAHCQHRARTGDWQPRLSAAQIEERVCAMFSLTPEQRRAVKAPLRLRIWGERGGAGERCVGLSKSLATARCPARSRV